MVASTGYAALSTEAFFTTLEFLEGFYAGILGISFKIVLDGVTDFELRKKCFLKCTHVKKQFIAYRGSEMAEAVAELGDFSRHMVQKYQMFEGNAKDRLNFLRGSFKITFAYRNYAGVAQLARAQPCQG